MSNASALPDLPGSPGLPGSLEPGVGPLIAPGTTVTHLDHPLTMEAIHGDGLLRMTSQRTGGIFQIVDPMTRAVTLPDLSWLETEYRLGHLVIDRPRASTGPAHSSSAPEYDHDEIDRLDPEARKKLWVVKKLIETGASCSDPDVGNKLDRIWTPEVEQRWGDRPDNSTARRWLSRVRHLDHVRLQDVMSMSGRVPRAPSDTRLDPAMRAFVEEAARWFYTGKGYNANDARSRVGSARKQENDRRAAEGGVEPQLRMCSRSTVVRAIKAIESRDTLTQKFGAEWVKRRYKIAGEGLATTRLLELVILDDQKLDAVFVLDAEMRLPVGRPWICLVVDVHTRCVLGYYVDFDDPTTHGALTAFKRATLPKVVRADRLARYPVLARIYGLPSAALADNGSNYVAPAFEDALYDCGTALRLAAVRTPTHKAIIERLFLSLRTMLTAKLPGATLAPEAMREMGLDPTREAALTLAELEELIEDWIYVHHVTVQSGIGMAPARAWELSARVHGIPMLDDPRRIDRFVGEVRRLRLTRNGVQAHGHRWRDAEAMGPLLDDLGGSEPQRNKGTVAHWVKVKINPADLREARIWNPVRRRYVPVRSATPRYSEGLSLFQHRQIAAWAAREALAFNSEEERLAARDELNRRILELAPEVDARERRAMARMLKSPAVQDRQSTAPVLECEPRHDGMGAVIDMEAMADLREDGGELSTRPAPGEPKTHAASPLDQALEDEERAAGPDDDWDDLDQDGADAEDRS